MSITTDLQSLNAYLTFFKALADSDNTTDVTSPLGTVMPSFAKKLENIVASDLSSVSGNFAIPSGTLGVGTSSPDRTLHVKDGNIVTAMIESTGTSCRLAFQASGSSSNSHNLIAVDNNDMWFRTNNGERLRIDSSGHVLTGGDGTQNLGGASNRWSTVYATTGTINTSDRNQKEQETDLDSAEKATALQIKSGLKKFKYKDAVLDKGDKARIHVGVIAQDVQQAFIDNGLDPANYALFCSDTVTDKEGEESDRLGIRYEELLCFIIASI